MTNIVSIAPGEQTMSSREIAELCGKRHDHVMRDARAMLIELHGEGDLPRFGGVYKGGNGEHRPCFNLPKRETLILVSGYNLTMRAKIIDRWQELETVQRPDPMVALNDPATMRGLLLTYSEKVMALEQENATLSPKAEALDRLATARGSLCISDAAKALQMQPRQLFDWLHRNRWIFRRAGTSWLGYSDKTREGLVEHKAHIQLDGDGYERVREQVRITPKGLAKLSMIFEGVKVAA